MSIRSLISAFLWYYRKHGLNKFVMLALKKAWYQVNNKECLFVFDLCRIDDSALNIPETYAVSSYCNRDEIPKDDLAQLKEVKHEVILLSFLRSFFARDATLWLFKINGRVVGLTWSLIGGFDGFYSVPIYEDEAIYLAGEVFPEFRGQRLYPAFTCLINKKLKEAGITRTYLKVHALNTSSLRMAAKMGCRTMGVVRTFKMFNRHFTVWNPSKYEGETRH